ncbi:hypothetical protein AB9T88_11590, partial [Flavobacterium sp. LBUM151]
IPVLNPLINSCKSFFTQTWTAVSRATGYLLDLSTDPNFTSFLPGYENKQLGNVTSETVTGIFPGTTYYVRLKAITTCGTSQYSNSTTVSPTTTTYNSGTWSNGLPDNTKSIVFDSSYNVTANMEGCSCQVNAGANVIVQSGITLKLENGLNVIPSGTLTFENNASLVQINSTSGINSGKITYKRTSKQIILSDFTYWSTPVNPQRLIDVSSLSPQDKFYSFNGTGWISNPVANNMMVGKGYIIRAPSNFSTTVKADYTASFSGVPNNGTISGETLAADKYYLIGNPYPSALNADDLLINNPVLEGTLYFWTHNTPILLVGPYRYNSDDYASYNLTGGVATIKPSPSDPSNRPIGKIAAGQSFFASTIAAGSVTFTNTMRSGAADNSQFYKQVANSSKTTTGEKHRFWLNLTNQEGAFKQLLVGYLEGATNGYESKYDGTSFDGNKYIDFYSVNEGNTLVIQGRALPFADTDIVPLGYKSTIAGSFTISIDEVSGLFTNQTIYLEDKLNNTYKNLSCGDYVFSTATGTFNNRFVIHYKNSDTATNLPSPVLNNYALNCNQTSYLQEWSGVENATGYRLDVATDPNFTSFLPDFENKELGNVLSDTITGIIPGNSYYVRLRAFNPCEISLSSNVLAVLPKSTTYYNGVWSNGLPDNTKNIIFNSNYNIESNMSGCSCQINAGTTVNVQSGIVFNLENALNVMDTGTLVFQNNASLVQINESSNTGKIIYKRISTPMKNFDYTYWSSPVKEQTLYNLSPNTLGDKYFTFDNNNWVLQNLNTVMLPARGYIIRTPKDGIWPNGEVVSFPYSQPVNFIGVPNNGHQ